MPFCYSCWATTGDGPTSVLSLKGCSVLVREEPAWLTMSDSHSPVSIEHGEDYEDGHRE